MEKIEVLKMGIFQLLVCSDITPDRAAVELEDAVAAAGHHPGTMQDRWCIDDSESAYMPVACEQYPGRWHYVLIC